MGITEAGRKRLEGKFEDMTKKHIERILTPRSKRERDIVPDATEQCERRGRNAYLELHEARAALRYLDRERAIALHTIAELRLKLGVTAETRELL